MGVVKLLGVMVHSRWKLFQHYEKYRLKFGILVSTPNKLTDSHGIL